MCRLFGMTTGGPRIHSTFWLLDAPDSLASQSRRMPDGTGLGWFSLGEEPVRDRAPIAAFQDADFNAEARTVVSHTFVSHVRRPVGGGGHLPGGIDSSMIDSGARDVEWAAEPSRSPG